MTRVDEARQADFFRDVDAACRRAVWAAVATLDGDAPRVRLVHPTWEGETLWFATFAGSPKTDQIRANPRVDLQYQVAPPDFVHVLVRGRAEVLEDAEARAHVWEVLDYDLAQFWPGGPSDPGLAAVRITPERVELSRLFGTQDRRVWRR